MRHTSGPNPRGWTSGFRGWPALAHGLRAAQRRTSDARVADRQGIGHELERQHILYSSGHMATS
jgi:hypothetical protein